jgi:hypothetical protein
VIKSDIYRFGKSKLFYGILLLTVLIALFLALLIRQDIRLGISVFGNLIAFRGVEDIIRTGAVYYNGLGVFVAILIAVFIGQEYQWKTWQHKWNISKSRVKIYLSKFALSSTISAVIFLVFQSVVLLGSNQTRDILTIEYALIIVSGLFIYAALGAVISMFSMLIKNTTASIIACLGYVLMSETTAHLIEILGNISDTASSVVGWFIRHSIYGMATIISSTAVTWPITASIVINALLIMIVSVAIGLAVFHRYEL